MCLTLATSWLRYGRSLTEEQEKAQQTFEQVFAAVQELPAD